MEGKQGASGGDEWPGSGMEINYKVQDALPVRDLARCELRGPPVRG